LTRPPAYLYACQYAPPHEFGVNLPKALARVRRDTCVPQGVRRALPPQRPRGRHGGKLWHGAVPHRGHCKPGPPVRPGPRRGFLCGVPAQHACDPVRSSCRLVARRAVVGLIRFWRQISASNESIARLDAIGEAAASVLTLITTAAMATAATMRTTPSPCGAGASITWPSRGSCSALRRSRWPPFITVCGVSRGDADNKIPAWRGLRRGLLLVTLTGAIQIFTDSLNCSQ